VQRSNSASAGTQEVETVKIQNFEQVYPRYPFATLVSLGNVLGQVIARRRRDQSLRAPRSTRRVA